MDSKSVDPLKIKGKERKKKIKQKIGERIKKIPGKKDVVSVIDLLLGVLKFNKPYSAVANESTVKLSVLDIKDIYHPVVSECNQRDKCITSRV